MNGSKARLIRKAVYGDKSHRIRRYHVTTSKTVRMGLLSIADADSTIEADDLRRKYQAAKKKWREYLAERRNKK